MFAPKFRHDFSNVRVHTDAKAADSARAVDALAYTVGHHVVFARGKYSPSTNEGRLLMAHELAHTIQQADSGGPKSPPLNIGDPADRAEHDADAAAHIVSESEKLPEYSVARARVFPSLRRDPDRHQLRRASVDTWAGRFYFDRYLETYDTDKDRVRPGVEIQISFTPNEKTVDATKIGFVQVATTSWNGKPYALSSEIQSRMIPEYEQGAGAHVDTTTRTPLAGMKEPAKGADLSSSVESKLATYGMHYKDARHEYTKDATMVDTPGFLIGMKDDAKMEFETAALAVDGTQKGAYYGSVQWGWTRQASQKPTKLPFTLGSKYFSGPDFPEAARLWNVSKTGQTQQTQPVIQLPIVAVRYTTTKSKLVSDPANPAKNPLTLDSNTAVEVTERTDPAHKDWQNVVVVSGLHAGKMGWIKERLSESSAPMIEPKKRTEKRSKK